VTLTEAQSRLIRHLLDELLRDPAALEHRWAKAAPFARQHAENNLLMLDRDWFTDIVIADTGEIRIIFTEDETPSRLATEEEGRKALFTSIHNYPELLSLLPARPADAITCSACQGTGIVEAKFSNPSWKSIICACGGAGWFPRAAVSEQA
jgi:hypothetical protein